MKKKKHHSLKSVRLSLKNKTRYFCFCLATPSAKYKQHIDIGLATLPPPKKTLVSAWAAACDAAKAATRAPTSAVATPAALKSALMRVSTWSATLAPPGGTPWPQVSRKRKSGAPGAPKYTSSPPAMKLTLVCGDAGERRERKRERES